MDLRIEVTVCGEIVPYAFADKDTGEQVGLVHLRVPGDTVSVNVEPRYAERMQEGQVWEVSGLASVRKKRATLYIHEPQSFKLIRDKRNTSGPTFDFGTSSNGSSAKAATASK